MNQLDFHIEWEDPQGAKSPELRATWANLKITAGGEVVSRLVDHQSNSVRDGVYCPLYPIAEWIAMNWWSLLYEVEFPGSQKSATYRQRHCLSWAGEGFALPHLWIAPSGASTRLQWRSRNAPLARLKFISEGSYNLSTESVQSTFESLLTAVTRRLEEEGVTATPLQEEWDAIQTVDSEEREFCIAAAMLGEDPFGMDDDDRERLVSSSEGVSPTLFDEILAVSQVRELEGVKDEIEESQRKFSELSPALTDLIHLRGLFNFDQDSSSWEVGYECARKLRSRLSLDDLIIPDDESMAEAFRSTVMQLKNAVLEGPLHRGVDAVVGIASDGSPAFRIPKARGDSRRFAFCRGLFEYITMVEPASLVSRAYSDRQQANRAFAAEFLAPAALLRANISSHSVSDEQIEDLAGEFGVSSYVVRHQIQNHSIAMVGA